MTELFHKLEVWERGVLSRGFFALDYVRNLQGQYLKIGVYIPINDSFLSIDLGDL